MNNHNLRPHDLIAKTARVTIKDTVRVLQSLKLVSEHLDCSFDDLIDLRANPTKPTESESSACDCEFRAMRRTLVKSGRGQVLDELRAMD